MNSHSGTKRLLDLLGYLHELTGLHFTLHSVNGKELFSGASRSTFCDIVSGVPEGYARCLACDKHAVEVVKRTKEPYRYRCHAGLLDIAIPVMENGTLVNVIQFGQILDDSPFELQWAASKRLCAWHQQQEALTNAYMYLPRLSAKKIDACLEIVNACVSEVRLEGLFAQKEQTDEQRLLTYINTFYARKLQLGDIARALAISKSKLCTVAARIEPNMTVGKLLTARRVEMAKTLLLQSNLSVRDVAEQVGVEDYNYFTKVFRAAVGITPSQYRKNAGK